MPINTETLIVGGTTFGSVYYNFFYSALGSPSLAISAGAHGFVGGALGMLLYEILNRKTNPVNLKTMLTTGLQAAIGATLGTWIGELFNFNSYGQLTGALAGAYTAVYGSPFNK